MQLTFQETLNTVAQQAFQSLALLLPKVLGVLLALGIAVILAKIVKSIIKKLLHATKFSKLINKTPLQFAFRTENIGGKIEDTISNIFYWLTLLIIIHTIASVLNINSLTRLLEVVLSYIPSVIAAMFILLFGVLVGGWLGSLIKNTAHTIDKKSAQLMGKIAEYTIITLAAMAALSELGIADQFINSIFIGFVAALSLGAGLAIGLGGQTAVKRTLDSWYKTNNSKKKSSLKSTKAK